MLKNHYGQFQKPGKTHICNLDPSSLKALAHHKNVGRFQVSEHHKHVNIICLVWGRSIWQTCVAPSWRGGSGFHQGSVEICLYNLSHKKMP